MAYNLLKGKKGLIFGALNEQSIAWKVAERAVEEGAEIVLTNTAVSIRMGTISQLAEKCNTIVVPADATSVEDLENLIDKTMEHFGGKFDFMLHSIGINKFTVGRLVFQRISCNLIQQFFISFPTHIYHCSDIMLNIGRC